MPNDVAIAASHEIEVRDLEYRRSEDGPLLARLYQPKGRGPFPALVEVHGGAWASGDRLNNAPLDIALAKSGIVVLAQGACGGIRQPRRPGRRARHVERRAPVAARRAEAERPAIRRAAAGRG